MSTATIESKSTEAGEFLYMSMELGEGTWKLGFTIGFGENFERRKVAARDRKAILRTMAAKTMPARFTRTRLRGNNLR